MASHKLKTLESSTPCVGDTVAVSGVVEKVTRRDGFRLVIASDSRGVIADFTADPGVRLRKGATVSLVGRFKSQGWATLCLTDCVLSR